MAMLKYDADRLKSILINREGYSEVMAELEAENLWRLNGELQEALDQWMEEGTVSNKVEVEGVNLNMIMKKKRTGFLDALGYMSVFLKEPEYANESMNRRRIVRGQPSPIEGKLE